MKLGDIIIIKNFFSGLSITARDWLLTFFFVSTLALAYGGGRHWYYNYLEKQHQSYRRDSLVISKLNVISMKLNGIKSTVDSLAKHETLQDEKLNTVGKYIQRIEHGNNSILYEFRRLDDLYDMFGNYKAPDAEKKNQLTQ
jgi:hypothetical protein